MNVTLVTLLLAALLELGYCAWLVRAIRNVRRQITRSNATSFKLQVRRAECWQRFCPDCKQIAAPWWSKS